MLYTVDNNGQISFSSKLDNSQKKEAAGLSAMRKFQSLDRQARVETNDNLLDTIHQNTITCIRKVSKSEFSTSGLDAQLVVWDYKVFLLAFEIIKSLTALLKRTKAIIIIECSQLLQSLENSISGMKIA